VNKVVDEDLREVVSTSCKAMHVIIFLWVAVRLSAHTMVTVSPVARHPMVPDSGANRLQCVGRAKRFQCPRTTAARGVPGESAQNNGRRGVCFSMSPPA